MWELSLIELLTYYSWPFVDIRLIEDPTFNLYIKYIHIFIWLSDWGGALTFVTGRGSISPPSGPDYTTLVIRKFLYSIKEDETGGVCSTLRIEKKSTAKA
jgi:hypothetical protein